MRKRFFSPFFSPIPLDPPSPGGEGGKLFIRIGSVVEVPWISVPLRGTGLADWQKNSGMTPPSGLRMRDLIPSRIFAGAPCGCAASL